jgi:hypothetical protein
LEPDVDTDVGALRGEDAPFTTLDKGTKLAGASPASSADRFVPPPDVPHPDMGGTGAGAVLKAQAKGSGQPAFVPSPLLPTLPSAVK